MKLTVLTAVLFAFSVRGALAQDGYTTWQGSFITTGERHRAVLQADQGADGKWTVRALNVDFLPEPVHLDSASLVDGHLLLAAMEGTEPMSPG